MDHTRTGLVHYLFAGSLDSKGQVDVPDVGCSHILVEVSKFQKQLTRNSEAHWQAAVDNANVIVLGSCGIVATPEARARSIVPDNAAGFLQSVVGVNDFDANHARIRPIFESLQQCFEPTSGNDRVVTQEHQIFSPSLPCARLASMLEALSFLVDASFQASYGC